MINREMKYFISCDWGTSRLRLRLVKKDSLQIIGEVISDDGIAITFNNWKFNNEKIDRVQFFAKIIIESLVNLESKTKQSFQGFPILCSGMASSSIGIKELDYAEAPFSINGSSVIIEKLQIDRNNNNDFWLISGLKNGSNLMRGEEVEIIGLSKILSGLPNNYLIILPGTHSKHVQISSNTIVDFDTFMTGELFELLSTKSTLMHSIEEPKEIDWNSYKKGVKLAGNESLLKNLFSVRVNDVLNKLTNNQNYSYLSGLIIGSELKTLKGQNQKILLFGKGKILELYQKAIQIFDLEHNLEVVSTKNYDKTILAGQLEIYLNNQK